MQLLRLIVFCVLTGSVFLASCASSPQVAEKKKLQFASQYKPVKTLLLAVPENKPEWVLSPPDKNDEYEYFVGISSEGVTSEKGARSDALRDAVEQFVNYTGVSVSVKETIRKSISGQLSQGLDGTVSGEKIVNMGSDAFVSRIKAKEFYFEKYEITRNGVHEKIVYKYYVKASVPLTEYDRVQEWSRLQGAALQDALDKRVAAVVFVNTAALARADGFIASGQPLLALAALSAEYNRLQTVVDVGSDAEVTSKATELQGLLPGRARAVASRLMLDAGRFDTIEMSSSQDRVVKAWAWYRTDAGSLMPVTGLPLSVSTAQRGRIANASTGNSGEASFFLTQAQPGQYLLDIDQSQGSAAALNPVIGAALGNVRANLLIVQGQSGLALTVKNTVRKLFDGAAHQQLVANKLLIGSITYGDTERGSGFALDLKRQLNEQLTNVDGLAVIAPSTRNRQEKIENTIKTRGITAIAKGGLGAAATHAAVDGADAALNAIYVLSGSSIALNFELKEAGSDRLLAVANGSFDSAFLPPGTDLVPTRPAQSFATPVVSNANNIKLEVTSHLGDGQTYREGETISYFVNSDTDAYLLLIYIDVDGNLIQILPNHYSGNAFYRKGSYIEVPDEADRERFEFTITGPFGLEHVWAFASSNLFPNLSGDELENGLKLLSGSFTSIRERLRSSAQSGSSAYGEAHTMVTTVAK